MTLNKGYISVTQKRCLLRHIRNGYTFKIACQLAGISRKQAYVWLKKDEKFNVDFQRARKSRIDKLRNDIKKSEDWRAKAWIAERCEPEEFGRHLLNKASESLPEEYITRLKKALTPEARILIYEDALNNGDLSLDEFNARVNAVRVGNELLTEQLKQQVDAVLRKKTTSVEPYTEAKTDSDDSEADSDEKSDP